MRLRTFAILAVALLILASGGAVWSQTVQGVITGAVTDPTGAVVPGATVTITNTGTNISQNTTTGSDGSYRFPLVPPGTYTLRVWQERLGTQTQRVAVRPNAVTAADFTLKSIKNQGS